MSAGRWLLIGGGIIVVVTVALSIAVIGTPGQQREARLDARRVADLMRIEAQIEIFRRVEGRLPVDLATLQARAESELAIVDQNTHAAYRYVVVGEREYQLCARFLTDSSDVPRRAEPWMDARWNHPAGEHCFQRKLVPDPNRDASLPGAPEN